MLVRVYVDLAVINDDELSLCISLVLDANDFFRLVYEPDEFNGYLVLEVYREVREEENALFNDLHISF